MIGCKNNAFAKVPPVDPRAVPNAEPSPSEDYPGPPEAAAGDDAVQEPSVPGSSAPAPAAPKGGGGAGLPAPGRAPGQPLELGAFAVGVYE